MASSVIALLVLLVFNQCHSQGDDEIRIPNPPVLNTQQQEVVLETGGTLNLRCTGDSVLDWDYPKHPLVEPHIEGRLVITHTIRSVSQEIYESVLVLYNASYADTGVFTCKYRNPPVEVAGASIYVFVKDKSHLFAPNHNIPPGYPIFMPIHQGQKTVIPCLVTNPNITVRFLKGYTKTEVKTGVDLLYDPQKGFVVIYPTWFYTGTFFCEASLGDVTEEQEVMLHFMASTNIPQPDLLVDKTNVFIGENLTLTCVVRVQKQTTLNIDWTYSSNEHSDRIRKTPPTRKSMESNGVYFDEVQSVLSIRAVRKYDKGVYRCTVTNHDGKSNFKEESIYVHEKTFVYLTATKNVVEINEGETSAILTVLVDAYPPFSL